MKLSLFLLSLLVLACTNKADEKRRQKELQYEWQYLTLKFDDTVIQLFRSLDSLEFTTSNKATQNYPIDKAEQDTLITLATELMNYNEQPKRECTDYVGNLKIRIRYNSQVLKEATFSSVCNWRELDSNTRKIDHLLKEIVKSNW